MAKKVKKLLDHARGQDCTLQIFPYCNQNPDTTVFCHFNSEDKGMALKSPDWFGAYGCSTCHAIIDGQMQVDLDKLEIHKCMMRGLYRTTKIRIDAGLHPLFEN